MDLKVLQMPICSLYQFIPNISGVKTLDHGGIYNIIAVALFDSEHPGSYSPTRISSIWPSQSHMTQVYGKWQIRIPLLVISQVRGFHDT